MQYDKKIKIKRLAITPEGQWRLLFIDGHGSHVTLKFLEWAQAHKILIAVYLPHSIHRLQPLDVGCFAPLATYYSQLLEEQTRLSEGQTRMSKRDFFRCFYPAWQKAVTEQNVRSSWRKAGLSPFDPALVLDKLQPREQRQPAPGGRWRGSSSSPPACWDTPSGMRKLRAIINQTVDKKTKKIIKRLSNDLHSSRAGLVLERLANQKTTEALRHQKKKKMKRGKKLMEQFRAQEGSGAISFSPGKVRAALELQERRVQKKEQEKADKQMKAEERALAKIQKQQEAQKKRDDRAAAKAAREAAKVLKKAQTAADRETKKARRQAEIEAKIASIRPRVKPNKK
jgi:hypothetical protein